MLPKESFTIEWLLGVVFWPSRKQLVWIDFTHPKVKALFSTDYDIEYDLDHRSDVPRWLELFSQLKAKCTADAESRADMVWVKLIPTDGKTTIRQKTV